MEAFFPLIIFALVIFGIWKALSGRKSTPSVASKIKRAKASINSAPQEYHWEGQGNFEFEIVGESHSQGALAELAGEHGTRGAETRHRATLLLEDSNPYDPKAVAVIIAGKPVGYLAREDARSYRRRLGQKQLSNTNATCDAIIVGGGTRRNGEKLFYGVKLDIKPFG